MPTVVSLYQTLLEAQRAVQELLRTGYPHGAISVLVRDVHGSAQGADSAADTYGVLAGGPLGARLRDLDDTTEPVVYVLVSAGLGRAAAQHFADALDDGTVLVCVHCEDRRVREAREILDDPPPAREGPAGAREEEHEQYWSTH